MSVNLDIKFDVCLKTRFWKTFRRGHTWARGRSFYKILRSFKRSWTHEKHIINKKSKKTSKSFPVRPPSWQKDLSLMYGRGLQRRACGLRITQLISCFGRRQADSFGAGLGSKRISKVGSCNNGIFKRLIRDSIHDLRKSDRGSDSGSSIWKYRSRSGRVAKKRKPPIVTSCKSYKTIES